ncbi:hypothetical protein HT578_17665 [Novosphingobium decolorationis]|uniref:Uncharacterized protein n=1 Tax=Novosphingobium decolorationis TaxID=2698673 RepID=A0ABX8E7W7_9SPHN|nr:hypothetical protein HT578_17665 [Novosphingobium decolorationis]
MIQLAPCRVPSIRHPTPGANGRLWSGPPRNSAVYRRREDIWRLAHNLLGGPKAADAFLSQPSTDGHGTLMDQVQASALGQLQVSHCLHRRASQGGYNF